jgi:predicted metal-dependent phosphoesterase TrpH
MQEFRVDLHVHSRFSGDNDADPEETVVRAIELRLQGVAFTEHYSYRASEHVETLREKYEESILLFRGVEFSAEEGHCLIFGVDTDALLSPHASVEEVVRIVSAAGGIVIPSHPYRRGTSLGDMVRTLKGISAIEGFNGGNLHALNVKAVETAHEINLPFTGGSDAHHPGEVGACVTVFDLEVTRHNLVDLLRSGSFRGVDNRKISRAWPGAI